MCPRLIAFMKQLTFLPNLSGSHQAKAAEWLFDQNAEQEKMDKCARKFKTLQIKVIGFKKFPSFSLSAVVWSIGPWKNPSLHKIHIFSHLIKISRNPPHQFSHLYHTGTVSVSYSRTIGQIQDIRTTNAATYVVLPYFRIHILKILDFSLFWFRPANLFVVLWSPV